MSTLNDDKLLTLHLRFLKEYDIIKKYKNEYHNGNKTHFNSGNLINDLKLAISTRKSINGFRLKQKGFTWCNSIYGFDFWDNMSDLFYKFLDKNKIKYDI